MEVPLPGRCQAVGDRGGDKEAWVGADMPEGSAAAARGPAARQSRLRAVSLHLAGGRPTEAGGSPQFSPGQKVGTQNHGCFPIHPVPRGQRSRTRLPV